MTVRFGTDGIRGRYPEPPMDHDTAWRLGRAVGLCFGSPVVVVRDTRESGPALLGALAAGLAAGEAACMDHGVLPTPALSVILAEGVGAAGVAITASHNPWYDNGLKVLGPDGCKLSPLEEHDLERLLNEPCRPTPALPAAGLGGSLVERAGVYMDAVLACLPEGRWLEGVTLGLDCANGAAWQTAPAILERLGARVVAIGVSPDGRNINRGVGALHPEGLAELVRREGAAAGIALDGDGDRCVLVDDRGRVVDGDALLWLLARGPGVVGTVMCNSALEARVCAAGWGFVRTAVGDRSVALELARRGWPVGGEPSGHVLLADGLPTGDGLLTALRVLAGGLDIAGRLEGWSLTPSAQLAVPVSARPPLEELPAVAEAERQARQAGAQHIVLRYSGTEPKLRVLVEAESPALAEQLARQLAERTLAAIEEAGR